MSWIEFVNIALTVFTFCISGAVWFIVNRINRLEADQREDVADLFEEIKSLGIVQSESKEQLLVKMNQSIADLNEKLQDKYVTKEWCHQQHRGGGGA